MTQVIQTLEPLPETIVPDAVISGTAFDAKLTELASQSSYKETVDAVPVLLLKDFVEVEISKNVKKQIGYKEFREILGRGINDTTDVKIEGLLPPSNLIFLSQTAKQVRLNCYYSSAVRDMLYGSQKLRIVTPNVIISHTLNKDGEDWVLANTMYFSTDNPISKLPRTFISQVSNRDRIYYHAMSNTYDLGNMCYGGNAMPSRFKDNNLRGLDYYFNFLWTTPFNDDLGIRGASYDSVRGWYRLLADLAKEKKGYPYDKLRGWTKHPDGITIPIPV